MNARLFIKRNSATILSFVAVAGVVATAITSANATPKAVRALDTAKLNKGEEELTKIEKVKTVLPVYLPTIITGAATVVCILGSNVLNQRTRASLSSAYAIVDQSYRDYRNKVKELYGEETDNRIIEAIAVDKAKHIYINASYLDGPCESSLEEESSGKPVLWYEEYSKKILQSKFRAGTCGGVPCKP